MIERYTRPQMGAIWTLENKYRQWLQVELAACQAWADLGVIPPAAVETIASRAHVDAGRIAELEADLRHDVVAFTTSIAEQVGPEARYFHYGLTSSDVVDTALALLLKEAGELLVAGLDSLLEVLAQQARRYKDTPMIGRTHGVHAEPTSFGLRLALWCEELRRGRRRLLAAIDEISVGKISGATGTYAQVPPEVEEKVCRLLGIQPSPISSQILQRDRHAAYMGALALVGASLEKFAVEIRGLQRTEIREVEEPFRPGQKGSSSMPHKRNPIICERITGLARVLRGNATVALENVALWHERDISHSSVERIVLPDSTILLDYMLARFTVVVRDMHVYPANMKANLERTGGLIFSQRVLLSLVEAGLTREQAYDIVQRHAMEAWEGGTTFRDRVLSDERVVSTLGRREAEGCFDLSRQLRHVDNIFTRLGLLGPGEEKGEKRRDGR